MLVIMICSFASAGQSVTYYKNMPQGTFKERRNGDIVHYNKNGKKIGVYRAVGRKYVKVK